MITFTAPALSYSLLAPILVVLGGALLGVLVEAFLSRAIRPIAQLSITLGTLVLAIAQLWRVRHISSLTAAIGSVAIDGAAILMQGSILLIAILGIMLIADHEHFTVLAAAIPGSKEESQSLQSGEHCQWRHCQLVAQFSRSNNGVRRGCQHISCRVCVSSCRYGCDSSAWRRFEHGIVSGLTTRT